MDRRRKAEGRQRAESKGRRAEDTPVEHPSREPGSTGQGGQRTGEVSFYKIKYMISLPKGCTDPKS